MHIYRRLFIFLVIQSPVFNCIAFEWHEHRNLGNVAIRISFDYFESKNDLRLLSKDKLHKWIKAKDELLFCVDKNKQVCQSKRKMFSKNKNTNEHDIRYGDIVKGVDDMRYPKLIFSRFNKDPEYNVDGYPVSEEQLNKTVLSLFFKEMSQDMLKASSNNFQHFQGELFEAMKSLHLEAIDVADHGNIFSALVMQALSDHFLHDIFAPGHVTTNRENSHDGVALAMHDWANDRGAEFEIDSNEWPILQVILEYMISNCNKYRLFYDKKGKALDRYCNADNVSNGEAVNQLQVMKELLENHQSIRMFGDNSLYKKHTQVIFMLLVEVRAILEVMYSYTGFNKNKAENIASSSHNNYFSYKWSGTYDYQKKEPITPSAGLKYGDYKFDEKEVGNAYDIIIYTASGQAPVDVGSSAGEISIEYVPLSVIGKSQTLKNMIMQQPSEVCHWYKLCNVGVAVGAVLARNDDLRMEGLQLRLINVQPKMSTLFSLYARRLNYSDDVNVDDWKSSYGIRFDTGFSMYSVFVGLENGYGYNERQSSLDRGLVVTFGIGIGIPISRHFP